MNILLRFILEHLSFLYGHLRFKFTDSICNDGENGDALVVFSTDQLSIHCVKDRSEISIYIKNNSYPNELFELSEIIEILTGTIINYAVPDDESIKFLKENFDEITLLLTEKFDFALEEKNKIRKNQLRSLGFNQP